MPIVVHDVMKEEGALELAHFFCKMDLLGFEYKERPADIETFIMSKDYLDLSDSIRPVILEDLKALFCDEESFAFCPYREAVFDEAIGSGKSFLTSIIIAYVLHHLLCMRNPQKSFNLEQNSMIAIMNMSVNAKQAKKVVFGEVKNRVLHSPWFVRHKPNPRVRSELQFPGNITIIPGHSGYKFPLGYNLIVGIMDEAAFYTETEDHDVAEEIFYALERRVQGRFNEHGLLIMISSPRYVDDFIERKMEEVKTDVTIFGRRRAIWEVLPEDIAAIEAGHYFVKDGVKIPKKYERQFLKNPEKAWRDLGAVPSLTIEPYFKQWGLIEAGVDLKMKHPFDAKGRLRKWFKPVPKKNYYMHIDLGLRKDCAGYAMAYAEEDSVVVPLMQEIKAPKDGEIDLSDITNTVLELKERGFKLRLVTYDQFQSASSIQYLKKKGINSERQSVEAVQKYETLKERIYAGQCRYYKFKPFLKQLRRLELIKGRKVDHPLHGAKDVTDGVCGAVNSVVKHESFRRKVKVG